MGLPELCIRRPVMTTLLMAALIVGGIFGYRLLAVSALPRVDFPTINIQAQLPGASPETMAASVATPIERQLATIPGINSMTSTSSTGNTSITVQFDLNRDIDAAALDVQSALSTAARRLPSEMPNPPLFRKVNPADAPVLFLTLYSDTLPLSTVHEYGDTLLAQQISQITGVAQVQVFGGQKYAVRVRVNPEAAASRGISSSDIQTAISSAASNTPVGVMYGPKQNLTLDMGVPERSARTFENLVIAWRNGAPVRLNEVATVSDGVENERVAGWINDTRSINLAIYRQPDANTIDVVDGIKKRLPDFRAQIPPAVGLQVLLDRSVSIRDSVTAVQVTLAEAIVLVVLVIFLFLRNGRATLIPSLALPLSIVGTFAVMWLLDFSINNMTLLALVLCVGFVVDDAIIVLENIYRYVEEGMSPFQAAIRGSREIGFTILSITFSLVAVFIPVLFMGGVVGRVFNEFAITISVAILISGFVSLTLTPMLCARLLRPVDHTKRPGPFMRVSESVFEYWLAGYRRSLDFVLRHRPVMLAVTVATLVFAIGMYAYIPKGFFPEEDTGFISSTVEAATDTSFEALVERQKRVADIVRKDPYVDYVLYNAGTFGASRTGNTGSLFIALKPREQRDHKSVQEIVPRLRAAVLSIPGVNVFFRPVQNINIGGFVSRSLYQYTLQSSDTEALYEAAPRMQDVLAELPQLRDVTSDFQITNPQLTINIDRDKARSLGITEEQIRNVLYTNFGTREVATLYTASNEYPVIVDAESRFQRDAGDLGRIYLRTTSGHQVPLNSVASVKPTVGPLTVSHQQQQPAVTISFNLAPGTSLGQAVDAIRAAERTLRPGGVDQHRLPGHGAGVPGFAVEPAAPSACRGDRHLHRARDPLRELHSPDHDLVRSPVGRHRRPSDAAAVQDGSFGHRLDRHRHADRHREEERDHDGRLCNHAPAGRHGSVGRDPRGGAPPLPADHDDDDGSDLRNAADRTRKRRGRRIAPAARHRGRRRAAALAAAHALHYAGDLRLSRPLRPQGRGCDFRGRRGRAAHRGRVTFRSSPFVPAKAGTQKQN